MRRTNIYLEDSHLEALDQRAAHAGVARAEIVRRLIDKGLRQGGDDLEAALAAIRDSAGAAKDMAEFRRSPDERSAYLDRLWSA